MLIMAMTILRRIGFRNLCSQTDNQFHRFAGHHLFRKLFNSDLDFDRRCHSFINQGIGSVAVNGSIERLARENQNLHDNCAEQ